MDRFIAEVDPEKMNRPAPYAPIRVSYHPTEFDIVEITERILTMQNAGFRVGIYGIDHPDQVKLNDAADKLCKSLKIDFRRKPFLGWHEGKLYGRYTEPQGLTGRAIGSCQCAPSELLIAPDGSIHRCHHYAYTKGEPLGNIADENLTLTEQCLPCSNFGLCNPCDIKVKNNRFQQFGHVAVKIRDIELFDQAEKKATV